MFSMEGCWESMVIPEVRVNVTVNDTNVMITIHVT